MKVAVIGAGAWGKNLIRVFHELGVLGMVCDPDVSVDAYAVPVYYELAPALMDDTITAVAIATPAQTHWEIARDAQDAGKDVFIEKPMCLSVAEGRQLVSIAEERGQILMVGHIMEYHPAIQEMIRQVHAGELGDILHIYSTRLSNGRVREHENCLWSFAPHDIAVLLRLMGGMPSRLTASGDRNSTALCLSWGKVQAHMMVSWLHPFTERKLLVVGSEKTLVFDGNNQCLVEHKDKRKHGKWIQTSRVEPLRLECQAFIDACEAREPPLTDGASGVRVLDVLEGAQRSMDRGRHA